MPGTFWQWLQTGEESPLRVYDHRDNRCSVTCGVNISHSHTGHGGSSTSDATGGMFGSAVVALDTTPANVGAEGIAVEGVEIGGGITTILAEADVINKPVGIFVVSGQEALALGRRVVENGRPENLSGAEALPKDLVVSDFVYANFTQHTVSFGAVCRIAFQ